MSLFQAGSSRAPRFLRRKANYACSIVSYENMLEVPLRNRCPFVRLKDQRRHRSLQFDRAIILERGLLLEFPHWRFGLLDLTTR